MTDLATAPPSSRSAPPSTTAIARRLIATRSAMTGTAMLRFVANPALEILLSLFVGMADGEAPTMADIAARTDAQPSTTMRWIRALESAGLVAIDDGAITLTHHGEDMIDGSMRALGASLLPLAG